MTIHIHLDTEKERITNLAVANAIMEMCINNHIDILNPFLIAKAILLQQERRTRNEE